MHVAQQADDDSYELGSCARITGRRVHCPVTYYADRGDYEAECRATIFVRLRHGVIRRGHRREPRCETY
jgi:hypothetical protein